jgi:hypothetical protein
VGFLEVDLKQVLVGKRLGADGALAVHVLVQIGRVKLDGRK